MLQLLQHLLLQAMLTQTCTGHRRFFLMAHGERHTTAHMLLFPCHCKQEREEGLNKRHRCAAQPRMPSSAEDQAAVPKIARDMHRPQLHSLLGNVLDAKLTVHAEPRAAQEVQGAEETDTRQEGAVEEGTEQEGTEEEGSEEGDSEEEGSQESAEKEGAGEGGSEEEGAGGKEADHSHKARLSP